MPDDGDNLEEYIERIDEKYPEALHSLSAESLQPIEELGCVNYDENTVTLYRGDSETKLRKLGYAPDSGQFEQGSLTREFPMYFTDNIPDAMEHASRKADSGRLYLIEIEVPFESVGDLGNYTEDDIEYRHESIDFNPPSVNFLFASDLDTDTEWVSTEIPEEWVKGIEEI